MKKYSVLSLFSGCGGLDLGSLVVSFLDKQYKQNAFEVVWANDIDKAACLTYENYFKHEIVCGDISEILSGKHIKVIHFHKGIVLGGSRARTLVMQEKGKALIAKEVIFINP